MFGSKSTTPKPVRYQYKTVRADRSGFPLQSLENGIEHCVNDQAKHGWILDNTQVVDPVWFGRQHAILTFKKER